LRREGNVTLPRENREALDHFRTPHQGYPHVSMARDEALAA
jgi:hypothetical protein